MDKELWWFFGQLWLSRMPAPLLIGILFLGDHFLLENGFSPCDTSQRDILKQNFKMAACA